MSEDRRGNEADAREARIVRRYVMRGLAGGAVLGALSGLFIVASQPGEWRNGVEMAIVVATYAAVVGMFGAWAIAMWVLKR